MTTDHTLDELDARARAAAADLRSVAEDRPRPEFDAHHVPLASVSPIAAPNRARRVLAVAAALAVVAGGVGAWWAAGSGDDDTGPASLVAVDDPRPHLLSSPPPGLELIGAATVLAGSQGADAAWGPSRMYGPAVDDPRLAVSDVGAWSEVQPGDEMIETADVEGREAYRMGALGMGGGSVIVSVDGRAVLLASAHLSAEEIDTLAASVSVGGGVVSFDPAAMPDGWVDLGEVGDLSAAYSPVFLFRGVGPAGGTFGATYGRPVDEDSPESGHEGFVSVLTSAGGEVDAFAGAAWLSDVERVTVRGHAAIVGRVVTSDWSFTGADAWIVSWVERPGEVLRVSGYGLDKAAVLAAAEGVVPVEAAEWADLVAATALGDIGFEGNDSLAELARGSFEDGTRWVLRYDPTDGVDLVLSVALSAETGGGGSVTSSEGSQESSAEYGPTDGDAFGGVTTMVEKAGRHFMAVTVGPSTATVEVHDSSGAVLQRLDVVGDADVRAVVAELPGELPVELVALDTDGAEVGRMPIEARSAGGFSSEGSEVTAPQASPTTIQGD